jgi:hypothetical protein
MILTDITAQRKTKKEKSSVWLYRPIIPAFGRLRKDNYQVQGQPGLHSKTMSQKRKKEKKKQGKVLCTFFKNKFSHNNILDTSKLVFLNSTEHTAEAELGSL